MVMREVVDPQESSSLATHVHAVKSVGHAIPTLISVSNEEPQVPRVMEQPTAGRPTPRSSASMCLFAADQARPAHAALPSLNTAVLDGKYVPQPSIAVLELYDPDKPLNTTSNGGELGPEKHVARGDPDGVAVASVEVADDVRVPVLVYVFDSEGVPVLVSVGAEDAVAVTVPVFDGDEPGDRVVELLAVILDVDGGVPLALRVLVAVAVMEEGGMASDQLRPSVSSVELVL